MAELVARRWALRHAELGSSYFLEDTKSSENNNCWFSFALILVNVGLALQQLTEFECNEFHRYSHK